MPHVQRVCAAAVLTMLAACAAPPQKKAAPAAKVDDAGINALYARLDQDSKRYENGLSTSFQVLQIQEDLTAARSRQVAAIAGYRRALGSSGRAISGYVSPFYSWGRVRENGQTSTHGLFRVSIGVDAAVLPQVGVTVGYETGAKAGVGEAGATGGIFGLGVSYALHRPSPSDEVEKPRRRAPRNAAPDSTSSTTPVTTPAAPSTP